MCPPAPSGPEPDVLRRELRRLSRLGLPATDQSAGDVLTEQRAVVANAQHPRERASRVSALDRLLRQLLDGFGDSDRGRAARILFAASQGLRGTTLTDRRERAAGVLDCGAEHFRKRIEPAILGEVAFSFHQENLRYTSRSPGRRTELPVHEDTPVLTDGSLTKQEEALCRVWSAVYGFRAELIATQRRTGPDQGEFDPDLQQHVDSAKWQLARLLTAVADYLDDYGETILHGETPFNIEGLVALAGWTGGLSSPEAKRLRYALARAEPENRQAFLEVLRTLKDVSG